MGIYIIALISEICIIVLIIEIYIIALYWYKIIVLIEEGYKRIFINPTGAEKQKFLYKKSGVFTLQLLFIFIHF